MERIRAGGGVEDLRTVYGILMAAVIGLTVAISTQAQPASDPGSGPLQLQAAVDTALAGNPSLDQLLARYQALREVPSQVGTLPDPVVSFGAANFPVDSFRLRQEPMTQLQFGISQRLPFPGKLGLAAEAAEHVAQAAGHELAELRLVVERDVRRTWWQIMFLDHALEIVRQNQTLLREFVDIATTKYEVGDGLQQDVLLAQVELSRLLDRKLAIEQERAVAAARLNRLLDRDGTLPVTLPSGAALSLPQPPPLAALFQHADLERPLLAAQQQLIEAASTRIELAERDYFPDFTVGATYGLRAGDNPPPRNGERADLFTLRVGLNLPIYHQRKRARAVSQRISERDAAAARLREVTNGVRDDIGAALARYRTARDQITLFDTGIIPQARQTVASMRAGYRVNQVDFLNLVRSQVTLLEHELQLWSARARSQQALADLRAAVGGGLDDHE